jgi:putative addiction module component (TIGR02574 family)
MDEIRKLSVEERIDLMDQIWDSIASEMEKLGLTEDQQKEVDRRLAAWEADPHAGSSWEEVKRRLMVEYAIY